MPEVKYPVVQIFTSIQGEGLHMGLPVTFIRLAGCNLRCTWCDTPQAFDSSQARWQTAEEIVAQAIPTRLVVITGGEPTLHDLGSLVEALKKRHKYVAIETNGTNEIPAAWGIDWITASPKPASGYILRCVPNELKYVVDDAFNLEVIAWQAVPKGNILLQVESGRPESAAKAYRLVLERPDWELRLGIQLHKVIAVE
ncbi:aldolase-type tim barrel [Lucifera butyrica]|uniref:7-carboxy-7-deazaguanine synthase n=1 Tax=Lucifera butyrica TaxID=1351585 RepID=A0A498R625_9FIRM|nr:7-carboxy-7-deazaguanine synthase QueE [Lucifera butyrica]VBB06297.1 aldolase-type tim barrel [Lucifera butyrica]